MNPVASKHKEKEGAVVIINNCYSQSVTFSLT